MKLLAIETEVGGLDPEKCSLLGIGLAVWDDGLIRGSEQIIIRPDIVKTSFDKLKTLDLTQWEDGMSEIKAQSRFHKFLKTHFMGFDKIMLLGHNIQFDIKFLRTFFGAEYFDKMFGSQVIDTCVIIRYLQECGKLPEDYTVSNIWEKFEIPLTDEIGQAVPICKLYNKLIEVGKCS